MSVWFKTAQSTVVMVANGESFTDDNDGWIIIHDDNGNPVASIASKLIEWITVDEVAAAAFGWTSVKEDVPHYARGTVGSAPNVRDNDSPASYGQSPAASCRQSVTEIIMRQREKEALLDEYVKIFSAFTPFAVSPWPPLPNCDCLTCTTRRIIEKATASMPDEALTEKGLAFKREHLAKKAAAAKG